MKKLLSIVLSVMMVVSVCVAAVPASAAVLSPGQTTTKKASISVQVNGGKPSTTGGIADVTFSEAKDDNGDTLYSFNYNGTGTLDGWDFGGMVEGVDYEIINEGEGAIVIKLLNNYNGPIVANAVVTDAKTTTSKATTTKKNSNSSTSPNTGAVTGAGLAVAGAGIAILAALKKKSDAE